MAGRRGIYVDGLRQSVRALEQAGVAVTDLKGVMAPIAAKGADVARGFTRRKSGALAATARGNKAKGKAVVTIGTARVRYAGPAVYGWPARNIAPARTLEQTDEVMDDLAPTMLADGINEILERNNLA